MARYYDEIEAGSLAEDAPDPGPDSGETNRTNFDDVNDYHNLANNGCINTSVQCPVLGDCPCDQNGDPIDALRGYSVTVSVSYDGNLGPGGQQVGSAHAELVTVQETNPNAGVDISLSGYRTRY